MTYTKVPAFGCSRLSVYIFMAAMTIVTSRPSLTSTDDQLERVLGSTAVSLLILKQQADDTFEAFKRTHTQLIPSDDASVNTHEKFANVLTTGGNRDVLKLPRMFRVDIQTGLSVFEDIKVLYQMLTTFASEYRLAVAKIRLIECRQLRIFSSSCPSRCKAGHRKHKLLCCLNNLHKKLQQFDNGVLSMMQELEIQRPTSRVRRTLALPEVNRLQYYLGVVYQLKTQTAHFHEALDIMQHY